MPHVGHTKCVYDVGTEARKLPCRVEEVTDADGVYNCGGDVYRGGMRCREVSTIGG